MAMIHFDFHVDNLVLQLIVVKTNANNFETLNNSVILLQLVFPSAQHFVILMLFIIDNMANTLSGIMSV